MPTTTMPPQGIIIPKELSIATGITAAALMDLLLLDSSWVIRLMAAMVLFIAGGAQISIFLLTTQDGAKLSRRIIALGLLWAGMLIAACLNRLAPSSLTWLTVLVGLIGAMLGTSLVTERLAPRTDRLL